MGNCVGVTVGQADIDAALGYASSLSNNAQTAVLTGLDQATAYASTAYTQAMDLLGDLSSYASQLVEIPDIYVAVGDPSKTISEMVMPDLPAEPEELLMNIPSQPVEPVLGDVAGLSLPDAPSFDATLPTINLDIAKPDPLTVALPEEPALIDVDIPAEPSITLPDIPTLESLAIPVAPVVNIPAFSASAPDAPVDAPDTSFSFTEPAFNSALLDSLTVLLNDWINGTFTGIEPSVEQAIWDRARAREDVASLRAVEEADRLYAMTGFSLPPGALAMFRQQAIQEAVNKNSSLSRDVAIKQAELEQTNRQFAIQRSVDVVASLLTYANQVAQRAFDVGRFTLQAAIDVFDAIVNRYNSQVQAYQVEASVYRARIEAELAVIEVYKAQIEGQRLIGEINMQQVEIYRARVQSLNALIDLYNGKVNAANTKASINKTIIDGFSSRVQAYDSAVKAKASEYEAYATEVRAEVSKGELFKVQADAYTSEVQGYAATVDARVKEVDANIKISQEVPLELFRQRVSVFGELVRAEGAKVSALADVYQTRGNVYQATASAQAAKVGAESDAYKAEVSLLLGRANVDLGAAQANLQKALAAVTNLIETMKASANIAAQIAASSMSAVNLSASMSASGGASMSYDGRASITGSVSASCTDFYNYKMEGE